MIDDRNKSGFDIEPVVDTTARLPGCLIWVVPAAMAALCLYLAAKNFIGWLK